MRYCLVFLMSALLAPFTQAANTFTFAPAPITHQLKASESGHRLELAYLAVDVPDDPLKAYGLHWTHRYASESGRTGIHYQLSGLRIKDQKGSTDGYFTDASIGPEFYLGEARNTILSVGLSMNLLMLSSKLKNPTIDATTDITAASLGVQLGLQHHFRVGTRNEIIPYALIAPQHIWTTTEVHSKTTSWSSYYSRNSNTSCTTRTLGLDLILGHLSLGAFTSRGSDNNVKMFRLGADF